MSSKNKLKKTHSNSRECDICVSLVGPVGCGKSALLVKYITHRFLGEYDPFYEGCWTKCENLDGIDVNLQVMDTYDKEKKNLEKYYKWSDALVLVYSVTCCESFLVIQEYLDQISEMIKRLSEDPNEKNDKPPTKIILLGNKIDIERHRQVNKQDVENLLEKFSNGSKAATADISSSSITENQVNLNLIHLESTSCEDYELVQTLFHKIIKDVRQQREAFHITNPLQIIEENMPKNQKSGKNRTKSPKHLAENNVPNHQASANNNMSPVNIPNNGTINSLSVISSTKDGSLKKNKFPFLNKILNKS